MWTIPSIFGEVAAAGVLTPRSKLRAAMGPRKASGGMTGAGSADPQVRVAAALRIQVQAACARNPLTPPA